MTENLAKLYNTLLMVETKGNNTKIMGDCLKYLEQLIQEQQKADEEAAKMKADSNQDASCKEE